MQSAERQLKKLAAKERANARQAGIRERIVQNKAAAKAYERALEIVQESS